MPIPLQEGITWRWTPFAELTLEDFYAVMQLRQTVFIVEQN